MREKKKKMDKRIKNLKYKKIAQKTKMKERGITLIALVVTIIILLILAGVTLNIALSNNGLFNKAKTAADEYNQKSLEEELQILYAEKQMENIENKSKGKADVTELLEEKLGEGKITKEDIEEFNEKLQQYGYEEEIKTISSAEEIAKIGKEGDNSLPLDGIYVQLQDFTLDTFTPIGTESAPFTGVYNGNGKKISSLTITATSDNAGMFGASEGTIKNVTVESCTISSSKGRVGAIAGYNKGLIENCNVKNGNINSSGTDNSSRIGGICGESGDGGLIKNCKNFSSVTGNYILVGGICGYNLGGDIEVCSNNGTITGCGQIGGIVGNSAGISEKKESFIRRCENLGVINGKNTAEDKYSSGCGGIVGCNFKYSVIIESRNSKEVGGCEEYVGGIVGSSRGSVKRCSNTAEVTGNKYVRRYSWRFCIFRRYKSYYRI